MTFIRWCGLAAIVGGVVSAALLVLGNFIYSSSYPFSDFPPILTSIFLLLLLAGALAAIAGVHALQRERFGRWGVAASLIAFVGGTLLFLAVLGGGLVELLAEQRPSPIEGATDIAIEVALTVGVLAATVGVLALGIATIAARVLPWWCGALIILGSPPAAFLVGPLLAILVGSPVGASWIGISWALVGYVLFRRAGGNRLGTPDA